MVSLNLILWLLAGLPVGLALGLTGGGGSLLAVPLLIYAFGLAPSRAVPLSLVVVSLASALGAAWVLRARQVALRPAVVFAVPGLLTAPLGLMLGARVPDVLFTTLFAAAALLVGTLMWRQAASAKAAVVRSAAGTGEGAAVCRLGGEGRLRLTPPCMLVLVCAGAVTGLLTGVLGVGGGFVIVPVLMAVTQLGIHRAVATSLVVITLISAGGAVSAIALGQLPWSLSALSFVLGGWSGMLLGRLLAQRLPAAILQRGFSIAIAGVGLLMVLQILTGEMS